RVGEVHGVDDHLDVGAVLARVELLRDVDQLDGGLVEGTLVVGVALPVGVGLLDDDLALLQQALEDQGDLELADLGVAHAEGDVLEVAEQGDLALVGRRPLTVGDGDDYLARHRLELARIDDVAVVAAHLVARRDRSGSVRRGMSRRVGLGTTAAARWRGHGCGLFEDRLRLLVLFVLGAGFRSARRGGVTAVAAAASAAPTGTAAAAFGGGTLALLLFALFALGSSAGGAELLGPSVAFRILVVVLLVVFVVFVETRLVKTGLIEMGHIEGLVEAGRVERGLFGRLGEGRGRQGRRLGGLDEPRRGRHGLRLPDGFGGLGVPLGGRLGGGGRSCGGGFGRLFGLPGFGPALGFRLVSVLFFLALSRRAHPPWTQSLLLLREPLPGARRRCRS